MQSLFGNDVPLSVDILRGKGYNVHTAQSLPSTAEAQKKSEAHRVMTQSRSGTVSRERDAGTEPAEREEAYG